LLSARVCDAVDARFKISDFQGAPTPHHFDSHLLEIGNTHFKTFIPKIIPQDHVAEDKFPS
jgi:hypothetical protein